MPVACGREVDDLADGGGVFVSGDDKGARRDLAGIAGLVEQLAEPCTVARRRRTM